jgi:hypothetical protein
MLFSGLGKHNGNTGIQITPVQFMRGSFTIIFDLTPDCCASVGHIVLPGNGNIHIDLKFEALPWRRRFYSSGSTTPASILRL